MTCSRATLLAAGMLGLSLLSPGASAQVTRTHDHDHPDIVIEGSRSRPVGRTAWADSTGAAQSGGVSITPDNQILVELLPEDTAPANPFDLDGRTLVFTPDGYGKYSRSLQSVAWEENIGQPVADGAEIDMESFIVDFAGRRWSAFFVNRHGLITFGERLTYSYWDADNRFDTMLEIAGKFVTTPTISPLYKPMLGGRSDRYGATQHVARWPDRVVVTWTTTEPDYYAHGVPPEAPARFQAVLNADGTIRFNYTSDVGFGDGIVGLFPDEEVQRSDLISSVPDPRDPQLPGHLDLLETALYETNTGQVILEFTTRDPIPAPPMGEYEYRLQFDTDRPWWTQDDRDLYWAIHVGPGGEYRAYGPGVRGMTTSDASNRIALLADIQDLEGTPASVIADIIRLENASWVRQDASSSVEIELPTISVTATDLSRSDRRFTLSQSEVFHYAGVPDTESIACRVIDVLGDEFDLFVFHNEFRVDSQESATPWNGQRDDVQGIGVEHRNRSAPCGQGRLTGHWTQPVWMKSDHVTNHERYHDERGPFDRGLLLFAHEFTHAWTAHLSYLRNGTREPLFGRYCQCHWRTDLHIPAAFPWHEDEPGPRSLMGGRYWRDNGDGTFTPLDGYWGGGHSWLDLYAMGLAEASEVPDMFILRNLQPVNEGDRWGRHTGDKEIVSIEQVVAAEGPREPSAAAAQKDFSAAFVYLLEPGQPPDADLLRLHAEYRDKVIEHWSHVTGGRSQMTTTVPGVANRSPVAVGGAATFTDDPILPGVTPIKAVHFTELRERIDLLLNAAGLEPFSWTDPILTAGVTPVRLSHLLELREALAAAYSASGRAAPAYTDAAPMSGTTPIRAVHLMELRAAIVALQ